MASQARLEPRGGGGGSDAPQKQRIHFMSTSLLRANASLTSGRWAMASQARLEQCGGGGGGGSDTPQKQRSRFQMSTFLLRNNVSLTSGKRTTFL